MKSLILAKLLILVVLFLFCTFIKVDDKARKRFFLSFAIVLIIVIFTIFNDIYGTR